MPPPVNRIIGVDHPLLSNHIAAMISASALYWSNHLWTALAAASAIVALISGVADRRRNRRSDMNAVGFMPWTAITVFAVLAAVVNAALALKGV
jgi:hypothetical protein